MTATRASRRQPAATAPPGDGHRTGALAAAFREQIEELLQQNSALARAIEQLYSRIAEAPLALATLDDRGVVKDLNRAALALLGIAPQQGWRRKPFLVFVHPGDVRAFHRHLAECRREGHARSTIRVRSRAGKTRTVELLSRTAHATLGAMPVFETVIHDMAAVAAREQALAESEQRYRKIVETANEGICIVDVDNRVVFANRRLATMLGKTSEALVGRPANEFVVEADRERLQAEFELRRPSDADVQLLRADGSALWASVSTSMLRDEHHAFTGMLHMYADASARHELQNARETFVHTLLRAQEGERARVARELHDQMGQHIVALGLGMAKLARLAEQDEDAHAALTQLRGIVELLGRDVHTLAFRLRPAALDHLGLGVALTSYAEQLKLQSGVDIDVHCADLSQLALKNDTNTAIYRIAQEAITNAVKHARASRVSVIIERREDVLLLIVEDDGIGLDEKARSSSSTGGVGLTGMRERATLLGGSLSVESSRGHGTTLYAQIPLTPATLERSHE